MMTPGFILSLIATVFAGMIFYSSYEFLLRIFDPQRPRAFKGNRFQRVIYASGLAIWFSAGVMVMITGLTGISNRLLLSLQ